MKVGDIIKLHSSTRRNGRFAGLIGLIVGFDENRHAGLEINVGGEMRNFHVTQVAEVINESR